MITRSGQLGRRTEIHMGKRKPAERDRCLAAGSKTRQVACPS